MIFFATDFVSGIRNASNIPSPIHFWFLLTYSHINSLKFPFVCCEKPFSKSENASFVLRCFRWSSPFFSLKKTDWLCPSVCHFQVQPNRKWFNALALSHFFHLFLLFFVICDGQFMWQGTLACNTDLCPCWLKIGWCNEAIWNLQRSIVVQKLSWLNWSHLTKVQSKVCCFKWWHRFAKLVKLCEEVFR